MHSCTRIGCIYNYVDGRILKHLSPYDLAIKLLDSAWLYYINTTVYIN